MKKQSGNKAKTAAVRNAASTAHKVWGVIALAGLFTCGLMLGLAWRGVPTLGTFSQERCDELEEQIVAIVQLGASLEESQDLASIRQEYAAGCPGRFVIYDLDNTPVVSDVSQPAIISTCARIEDLLQTRLYPEDSADAYAHLKNAETYAAIAEYGCAENADKYKALALREIQILNALQPVESMDAHETEIIIDTYKKLDMQQQAQEFLNKIEQLTDPAIEFILKMEKIINE